MMGKKRYSSGDNSVGSATASGKKDRKVFCSICKETGHVVSSAPIGSAASAVKPDPTLTNFQDGRGGRGPGDFGSSGPGRGYRKRIVRVAKSKYAEDAFISVSFGEYVFRFGYWGETEGLDCDIREIETWIVDSAATRHMIPNPTSMTNYCECDGVVSVANGAAFPFEGGGDILMSI